MIDASLEQRIGAALDRGDLEAATTEAVRGYGAQIAGYLRAVLGSDDAAAEAFSIFCEFVWIGIGKFRRQCSFFTWSHHLAWGAVRRIYADPYRKRARRLMTSELERVAAHVFSTSLERRRDAAADRLAELRHRLTPAEQTLLILRLDRNLSWSEIAQVLEEDGAGAEEAALRKRFERLRAKIRTMAEREGLL
jgi:RNA polymerase sigma-70 factor, ECF subfamily